MVRTSGLTRHFVSKKETVEAVRGLDLTVERGELVALLGPNGAGKSTTLRMLTTLIPPTRAAPGGRVRRRHRAARGPAADRLHRAGQRRSAQPARPRRAGQPGPQLRPEPGDARQRAAELIESLDLAAVADRNVSTLSGGPAPAPGHRHGAHPRARAAVPGRAVDRSGPAEPGQPPGARPGPARAARDHDRDDDALPRGGGRHRRARRGGRPRQDHRRRHTAPAQGRAGW